MVERKTRTLLLSPLIRGKLLWSPLLHNRFANYGAKARVGAKKMENEKTREARSEVGRSSKRSLRDVDDLEVLEEEGLSKKARKPWTSSSRCPQNLATLDDEVPLILED
ncbi:hypothetical protein Fot_06378 [Forsythia ovata]|uniref:Uncharacterized protein n=1 Tax=Forsythia ovata TaxID=205694 RepID=A0ABD1WSW7_9LAMI